MLAPTTTTADADDIISLQVLLNLASKHNWSNTFVLLVMLAMACDCVGRYISSVFLMEVIKFFVVSGGHNSTAALDVCGTQNVTVLELVFTRPELRA